MLIMKVKYIHRVNIKLLLASDVADGVYMVNTSPVSTEMNKGPSTPTTVLTLPSFTDGKWLCIICLYTWVHVCALANSVAGTYVQCKYFLEQSISNAIAIPETRSRRCARDQRDQPSVKYDVCMCQNRPTM